MGAERRGPDAHHMLVAVHPARRPVSGAEDEVLAEGWSDEARGDAVMTGTALGMLPAAGVVTMAAVPVLAEDHVADLVAAVDRPGVVAASLIGSQARGDAGPLSDVDLGVWVEPRLGPEARFALQDAILAATIQALGREDVDIVVLNDVPPTVRHRAVRDSRLLVERDRDERVRLETAALLEYFDTEPLRALRARHVGRRLDEGSFGRP